MATGNPKNTLPGQRPKKGRPPIKPKSTKRSKVAEDNNLPTWKCCCCGHPYENLDQNFYATTSALFKGWDGHVPICKQCAQAYCQTVVVPKLGGDEYRAMEYMCQILDWYWSDEIMQSAINTMEACAKRGQKYSLVSAYSSRRVMIQASRKGTTYLDTIMQRRHEQQVVTDYHDTEKATIDPDGRKESADENDVWFFGPGYTPAEYRFLREQYDDWCSRYDCQTKAQEEIFKSITIAQINVQKSQRDGDQKRTTEAMKTLQELMDSAKIKPKQKDDAALVEQNTFGTLIRKWEDEEPIPEPKDEWKDVDGIRKYVGTWFFGHLAKMFQLDNDWADMYEEEMAKYTVEPPRFEEEVDTEDGFDAIFGKQRNKNSESGPDETGGDDG